MRKIASLLIAMMLISLLASSSTMATSTSSRSRGVTIVEIVSYYMHAFYGHIFDFGDMDYKDPIDDDGLLVGGDADDLGGGKIDRLGNESRDPNAISFEGTDYMVTKTD